VSGSKAAVLSTLAAGLLWGSSFSVIKIGLRSIDPYWFVFMRFALAAAIALAYLGLVKQLGEVLRLLRHPLVIWLGVTNAVGFAFQFKGQTLTTTGNAALIINSCTIYVAIASRFVFREPLGFQKLLGVALGTIGVLLVTTARSPVVPMRGALRGDLLVLAAAFTWTAFILLDKYIVAEFAPDLRALTGAMVVVTAAAAAVPALVLARGTLPRPSAEWWAIPYTAVFCTIVPFFLWTSGLRFITATVSSVIMLSEVVFALVLAAVVLGERPSAVALVGGVLILSAVLLASREAATAEVASGPDVVPE